MKALDNRFNIKFMQLEIGSVLKDNRPFLMDDENLSKLPPLYKWDKRLKDQHV